MSTRPPSTIGAEASSYSEFFLLREKIPPITPDYALAYFSFFFYSSTELPSLAPMTLVSLANVTAVVVIVLIESLLLSLSKLEPMRLLYKLVGLAMV